MKTRVPDLALLRSLLLVSESASLEEAARTLGLTQSALSYQLKRLEEGLPSPVFTVEGRRKVLTHFGRALCDFAREETQRLERGLEVLERAYADPKHLTLRVACRQDRFVQVRRRIEFPGTIEFVPASSVQALAALKTHEVDIAICHELPDVPEVVAKPLFASGPWVICHPKWLRGRQKSWARDPEFLKQTPVLIYQVGEAFIDRWFKLCGVERQEARIRLACQDWDALIAWVTHGEGYAIVPGDLAQSALERLGSVEIACYEIPASEIPPISFYAAYHRDLRKTQGLGAALKILADESVPRRQPPGAAKLSL